MANAAHAYFLYVFCKVRKTKHLRYGRSKSLRKVLCFRSFAEHKEEIMHGLH